MSIIELFGEYIMSIIIFTTLTGTFIYFGNHYVVKLIENNKSYSQTDFQFSKTESVFYKERNR